MLASSLRSLLFISLALSTAHCLTCYVNDASGNVVKETRASWKYCSLTPFAGEDGKGRLAGVGAETESLVAYEATFGQNSNLYTVLTMCTLEKYDFHAINPAFGPAPEFMFRCFCNTNGCNQASTFGAFLANLRH